MTQDQHNRINYYSELLDKFVAGRLTPSDFVTEYLAAFKAEQVTLPECAFARLDRLFGDADAYCEDESIRGLGDIGAAELKERAARTLQELRLLRQTL